MCLELTFFEPCIIPVLRYGSETLPLVQKTVPKQNKSDTTTYGEGYGESDVAGSTSQIRRMPLRE